MQSEHLIGRARTKFLANRLKTIRETLFKHRLEGKSRQPHNILKYLNGDVKKLQYKDDLIDKKINNLPDLRENVDEAENVAEFINPITKTVQIL